MNLIVRTAAAATLAVAALLPALPASACTLPPPPYCQYDAEHYRHDPSVVYVLQYRKGPGHIRIRVVRPGKDKTVRARTYATPEGYRFQEVPVPAFRKVRVYVDGHRCETT